ncbi:RNA-directed DNA polymerase, eukaryota, partial [Tanacetum coccineum]
MSMHGSSLYKLSPFRYSTWKSIIREVHMLKDRGVDLISHCHIRVGNGLRTQFWNEVWIGDTQLRVMFPRIYALEINKDCTVADKLQFSVTSSLRRSVRGGVESSQLALLQTYIEGTLLSNMEDRWVWDLNGEGVFRVKDVRILLDECFLPKAPTATRWVKYVPIKINVFAWKVFLDRLPTRSNLQHRGVLVSDLLCPLCSSAQEDSSHLFFSCRLATDIVRLVYRWWNLSWTPLGSYADWLNWFNSIRLSSKVKDLLEGVLYITWWSVWMFRNQLLFSSKAPRKDVIFDDIVSRSFTWCLSRNGNMKPPFYASTALPALLVCKPSIEEIHTLKRFSNNNHILHIKRAKAPIFLQCRLFTCMQTRSSLKFVGEPSTYLKRRNRRRSKQRVKPFALEETPVVTMADQRTMAELLRAPTEGYAEEIVVPLI